MSCAGGGSTPHELAASTLPRGATECEHRCMRYESCVTSLSWIPSEAVTGATPDGVRLRVHALRRPACRRSSATSRSCGRRDRFRFANVLRAWIEVDDSGRITGGGYDGGGIMGATTLGSAA